MLTSKLNHFPVKFELPSGADRFCPTFFVILCTFVSELSNVRARKGIKVPDVSRHSGRCAIDIFAKHYNFLHNDHLLFMYFWYTFGMPLCLNVAMTVFFCGQ